MDKPCFQNNIGYGGYKDRPGRTAADTALHDKAFGTTSNP